MKKIKKGYILLIAGMITLGYLGCNSGANKLVLREVPRTERTGLMVLNFNNSTLKSNAMDFQPWEFGIASMVMTDLEAVGLFNITSLEKLKDILKQQAFQMTGIVDEKQAVKAGKIVAAKFVLTGSFMEINGKLMIQSQIFSVEKGTQLGAASVTGKTENFFDLEKQLVIKLTDYLGAVLSFEEKDRLARNIETRSVEASLNNYAGEVDLMKADDLKSKGRSDQAEKLIREARNRFKAALHYDSGYERAKNNLAKVSMGIPMTL